MSQKERQANELTYKLNKIRDLAKENVYIMYPALKNSLDYLSVPNKRAATMKQMNKKYPQSTKNLQNLPSIIQKSYDNLKISSELDIIRRPPRVQSLSEMNKQVFYIDPKNKKKKKAYQGIDNQLQIPFPIHNEKDFVNLHSLGFKGKKNIDLFKHYLRMYMKNKFKVNQIKKERRDKINKIQGIEPVQEQVNPSYRQSEQIQIESGQFLIDSIFENIPLSKKNSGIKSPLMRSPKNSQFITSLKKSQDLVRQRLSLQEFIVDKSLNDVILFDNVITAYEQQNFSNQAEINFALNKQYEPQNNSLLDKLSEKMQNKVNIITMDPSNLPSISDDKESETLFLIEEIFITQIMNKIAKHGLDILSLADYRDFKRVVGQRKRMLQNLSDQIRVQKLLNINKNLNEKYTLQREQQEEQDKIKFQQLKQDEYLKCTKFHISNKQENESRQKKLASNQEVSLDNTSAYFTKSDMQNEYIQNLSIKLSPITKNRQKNFQEKYIKIFNTQQQENIGINSPNISDLQTNREKYSMQLDYTNIEEKKKDEEEIETQENLKTDQSFIRVEMERLNDNISNLVQSKNQFIEFQERLKQRMAERSSMNYNQISTIVSQGSHYLEDIVKDKKVSERIDNDSFFQQEKSSINNGEQQSTRFISQINDMNSISKSNQNSMIDNSNLLANVDYKDNTQRSQIRRKKKDKQSDSQQSQLEQKQTDNQEEQKEEEVDETIELLLDVAQKHGLQEELMKLFELEEGQQQLTQEEKDERVKKFMEKVQEYIKEEEFQQKLKQKQKEKGIKFQKKEKKPIKKKRKITSNQNLSQINLLDDPSLMNINSQVSRGSSLNQDQSNSSIDIKNGEKDNLESNDNIVLDQIDTSTQNQEIKMPKQYVSKLNFTNIKRLPIASVQERVHTEEVKSSRSDYLESQKLNQFQTQSMTIRPTNLETEEEQEQEQEQKRIIRKKKDDMNYYELYNEFKPNNKSETHIPEIQEKKGHQKLLSQRALRKPELDRIKPTPKSQAQVGILEQQYRLQESIKKKNLEIQRLRQNKIDINNYQTQLHSKKRDLQNALKINFGERSTNNLKARDRNGSQSPVDKTNNSSFRNTQQQIQKKDDHLIQAQRRELMIKYYGEEKRFEIMNTSYTYEEEKEIKEKLKARDEALKKKMKVAATKMNIEQDKYEDLDPEMLIFQDLLVEHKKANEKLFQKIVSPQKKKKQLKKINFEKKLSEQIGVVNNEEDKQIVDKYKHAQSVQLPGFFENQKLLQDIEKGVYDVQMNSKKQTIFNQPAPIQENQPPQVQEEIPKLEESKSSKESEKLQTEIPSNFVQEPSQPDINSIGNKTVSDYRDTISSKSDQGIDEQIEEEEQKDTISSSEEELEEEQLEEYEQDKASDDNEDINQGDEKEVEQEVEVEQIVEKEVIDNQGNVTVQQVVEKVIVKKQLPAKKQTAKRYITPQKKKNVQQERKKEKKDSQDNTEGENKKQITREKRVTRTKKESIEENRQTINDSSAERDEISFIKAKESKQVIQKKKKKVSRKIDESDNQDSDSQQGDIKNELEDSVLEGIATQNQKIKLTKKKVAESNFLKVPKQTGKKKRETIEIQLDQSSDGSSFQLSSQQFSSVGQSLVEDSVTEIAQKGKKQTKESRAQQEKRQKKEEERLKKEEERQRREEEKQRKEEERQKKEEERLRKEEEKRKIELEKQRIKEERQRRFNQELEKLREFNFADEMELLKKRKLTLRELKEEIEYTIEKLGDSVDEESKYNILSYRQRIEQIQHFLESVENAIDTTIENKDNTVEQLKEIFNTKNRWVRDKYKDKILKFQREIQQLEADDGLFSDIKGEAVGEQEIQLILKYASLNQDVEGILARLIQFKNDTAFLIDLKSMIQKKRSKVIQISLDEIHKKKQTIKEELLEENEEKKYTQNTNLSKSVENSFNNEQALQRLRRLKKYHKERFQIVLENSNSIRENNNFLKSINYSGGIDNDIINYQTVAKKQQIWYSKFNPYAF